MTRYSLYRQHFSNHLLRGGLLIALLFGSLHVALHGLDGGALTVQDGCQVCRLAHSPTADLPLLAPMLVGLWLGFQHPLLLVSQPARVVRRVGWARAPPQV